MTKTIANHLKLHVEEVGPPETSAVQRFAPLCRAFEAATGWTLTFVADVANGPAKGDRVAASPASGSFVMQRRCSDVDAAPAVAGAEQVQPLVNELNGLLRELSRAHTDVWKREAELAAGVPVVSRPDEHAHLAERLTGVLRSGAEAVGCQAAAAYLLDDATSELKLRAGWGLPRDRWLEPARPLRGELADLEALLGHAVVLRDVSELPHWKCPEDFPAAVCVPISSPSMPLGTMWVFCDEARDFTPDQTNLLEIVAGRLAAELEREMLLSKCAQQKQSTRDESRVLRWQQSRLPQIESLDDAWDVAGWSTQSQRVGGQFFDWAIVPDGNLTLAVGNAAGMHCEATLTAATLQGALKALTGSTTNTRSLFTRLNDSFWMSSPGDQYAGLVYATIEPESGNVELLAAGGTQGLIIGPNQTLALPSRAPSLGLDPDWSAAVTHQTLVPGDMLLLYSAGSEGAVGEVSSIDEGKLAEILGLHRHRTARQCIRALRAELGFDGKWFPHDATFLIAKRRR